MAEKGTDGICHNADPERLPERGRDEDDGKAIEGDHKVRYDGAGDQYGRQHEKTSGLRGLKSPPGVLSEAIGGVEGPASMLHIIV
nr:hypothetical protein [Methanoculleus marisnigri]